MSKKTNQTPAPSFLFIKGNMQRRTPKVNCQKTAELFAFITFDPLPYQQHADISQYRNPFDILQLPVAPVFRLPLFPRSAKLRARLLILCHTRESR